MDFKKVSYGNCLTALIREDYATLRDLPPGVRMFVHVDQGSQEPSNYAEAIILSHSPNSGVTIIQKATCFSGASLFLVEFNGTISLIKRVVDSSD